MPDTITTPTPKLRSFRQRRSTTGFSTISSQAIAADDAHRRQQRENLDGRPN